MKTFFKKTVAILVVIFLGVSSLPASDDASYSGYSVSRIINNTTNLLIIKNLLSDSYTVGNWYKYVLEAENQEASGMLPSFPFFDFENSFMNYCIGKKLITKAQANLAIDRSKHCGGLILNGYNLLVLHAMLLGSLVDNKHLTRKEAQTLLDSCRKKTHE